MTMIVLPAAIIILAMTLVGLPLAAIGVLVGGIAFVIGPVPAVTALGNRVMINRGGTLRRVRARGRSLASRNLADPRGRRVPVPQSLSSGASAPGSWVSPPHAAEIQRPPRCFRLDDRQGRDPSRLGATVGAAGIASAGTPRSKLRPKPSPSPSRKPKPKPSPSWQPNLRPSDRAISGQNGIVRSNLPRNPIPLMTIRRAAPTAGASQQTEHRCLPVDGNAGGRSPLSRSCYATPKERRRRSRARGTQLHR